MQRLRKPNHTQESMDGAGSQKSRSPVQAIMPDHRPAAVAMSTLQRAADASPQVRQLQQLSQMANASSSMPLQLKTVVDHTSIDQAYRSGDDARQQKMGVEMEAFLDPWNPLHGTESAAFVRHGIYVHPHFRVDEQGATAMHLLNANFGGLAVDENLFPADTNKNGQHLKSGETEVKNKLLTLHSSGRHGHRVWYRVQFRPPGVLTPENFTSVPLAVQHTYMDEHDRPYVDMVDVSEDPNTGLTGIGWTNDSRRGGVAKGARTYLDEQAQGDRATSVETISHRNDPADSDAVRMHAHLAHEDRDLLGFGTSLRGA